MIEHNRYTILVDLRKVGELAENSSRNAELIDGHVKVRVSILSQGAFQAIQSKPYYLGPLCFVATPCQQVDFYLSRLLHFEVMLSDRGALGAHHQDTDLAGVPVVTKTARR
jgi:hypothetical protein